MGVVNYDIFRKEIKFLFVTKKLIFKVRIIRLLWSLLFVF